MGKVQAKFINGPAGTVSRAHDNVIISIRNGGSADIPFGAPVFLNTSSGSAVPFSTASPQDFSSFLGFAVRVPDKTPDTFSGSPWSPAQQGVWKAGELMEVLVRGSITVAEAAQSSLGSKLYIRKSDGKITANPGTEGSTVLLENVYARGARDANGMIEAVVTGRNIQ